MPRLTSARRTYSAWRIGSALMAAAALLPAAATATLSERHTAAATATHAAQQLAASGAPDVGTSMTTPLWSFATEGGDTASRHLLRKGKGGQNAKKGKKEKVGKKGRKGNKGKEGKKGRMRDQYPPTPAGEAQCMVAAAVEEVVIYDADFLHASASAPPPCSPSYSALAVASCCILTLPLCMSPSERRQGLLSNGHTASAPLQVAESGVVLCSCGAV